MAPSLPEPQSVLVINVSRIGDTILVTPALRALAKAWPRAHITFLGHPKRVEVVANLPELKALGAITKQRARWRGWLARRRHDLALVFGFDRSLVRYALRVSRAVVAFRQGDPVLDARLHRCVEPPAFQSLHSARIPLLLTRALGLADAGERLAYAVSEEEKRWAHGRRPPAARPLVGFQVASFPTKGYRDWPLEHFAALGERIFAAWPRAHLLLFGGELERARVEALAQRFGERATSYAGKLTLRESAALMNELDLYVGVDTGPTHIMGALDAPMVALYHCYSPSRLLAPLTRPRFYAVDHPRAAQSCSPETPMAEIPVETVWTKVRQALAGA